MNMLKRILPAAAVFALVAAPGLAAVQGSHHDLSTWNTANEEVCLFCHGVASTVSNAGFGAIGDLCVSRCHVGGTASYPGNDAPIPNRPNILAEDGTLVAGGPTLDAIRVAQGYGHGLNRALLYGKYGTGGVVFDTLGGNLPYTGGTAVPAPAARMECTSCHNVHNYQYTPFLQRDLFTGGPGGNRSFCEACHFGDRGNNWAGGSTAPNGDHPVNFSLIVGDSPRNDTNDTERLGRYIILDRATSGENIFDVASPNGTNLSASDVNYLTGGKLSGFASAPTTAGATTLTFGCYTCHGAHMDNAGATGVTPNLILGRAISANGEWNPLCVGCHGEVANGLDDANPGLAASAYYHPAGGTANASINNPTSDPRVVTFLSSTGSFEFSVELTAISSVGGQGSMADGISGIAGGATNPGTATTWKPRCTSCHDVHGGLSNSQALIELDGTRNGTLSTTGYSFCEGCHNGVGLVDVADNATQTGEVKGTGSQGSHHRTRTSSWAAGNIADQDTDQLVIDAPSWASATTATLDCADCHVFTMDTHQTAHNW